LRSSREEVARLEGEADAARARHEESHRAAVASFSSQLAAALAAGEAARREGEGARKEADAARAALETVQRLQAELAAARRERSALSAAMALQPLPLPPPHVPPALAAAALAASAGTPHS
jgi:hypothetical protein